MNYRRVSTHGLLLGCVSDITTTFVGLEYTTAVETNPFVAPLMAQYGYAGMLPLTVLLLVVAFGGASLIERWNPEPYGRYGATVTIGLIAAMKLLVSLWNAVVIYTAA